MSEFFRENHGEAAVWKTSTLSDLVRMYLQWSREPLPSGFLANVVFLAKITPYKPTSHYQSAQTSHNPASG
jgi:hypothetical protein